MQGVDGALVAVARPMRKSAEPEADPVPRARARGRRQVVGAVGRPAPVGAGDGSPTRLCGGGPVVTATAVFLLFFREPTVNASAARTLPPSAPARVVVLASGSGTLMQALLDAAAAPDYPVRIVGAVLDRECAAEQRAETAGVPSARVRVEDHDDRAQWDGALADKVAEFAPDLVVSAGFMKILGAAFLERFGGRVINTHPALLPAFPGAHGVRDALAYGVKVTGSTVHLVDEGVDTGPILAQEAVAVEPGDDEATLHERIKTVERRLLVDVVAAVARRGVTTDGRKAQIQ